MKTRKIIAILTLIAILTACSSAFAASGTYTAYFTTEDMSGSCAHSGFIAGVGASEKNTLVLNEDGTYEYTKFVSKFDENQEPIEGALALRFVFTGSYEEDGNTITLKVPTECVFSEDWASLAAAGYFMNSEGKASEGDIVQCKETQTHDPMLIFPGPLYQDADELVDVVVTINTDGTFTYNAVASSDDD